MGTGGYRGYRDLRVYRLPDKAFGCVIGRGVRTGTIPSLLPSQKHYLKVYSKLIDCAGEAGETEVWLDFSKDFGYISSDVYDDLMSQKVYNLLGAGVG